MLDWAHVSWMWWSLQNPTQTHSEQLRLDDMVHYPTEIIHFGGTCSLWMGAISHKAVQYSGQCPMMYLSGLAEREHNSHH